MREMLHDVDAILRGKYTGREALADVRPGVATRRLLAMVITLGAFYGACMGVWALLRIDHVGPLQVVSAAVKVPALFLLTLVVTGPSLIVFSALCRSRLTSHQTLALLLTSTAAITAVLASLGPVTVFFTVSTTSHTFIQLLNVVVFAISGAVGLSFLRAAAKTMFAEDEPSPGTDSEATTRKRLGFPRPPRLVFVVWLVIYAVVGAQMGWILRPFIGTPHLPWELFRGTESNILDGVAEALRYL